MPIFSWEKHSEKKGEGGKEKKKKRERKKKGDYLFLSFAWLSGGAGEGKGGGKRGERLYFFSERRVDRVTKKGRGKKREKKKVLLPFRLIVRLPGDKH